VLSDVVTVELSEAGSAPSLSFSVVDVSGGTISTSITASEPGTFYLVVVSTNDAPSIAQVKAGQDHTGGAATFSDDIVLAGSGSETSSAFVAPAGTYYAFAVLDGASGDSDVAAGGAVSSAVPALSAAEVASNGTTLTVTFNAALDGANDTSPSDWTVYVDGTPVTLSTMAIDTFTIAAKIRRIQDASDVHIVSGHGANDSHIRLYSSGNMLLRIEDTAGAVLINDANFVLGGFGTGFAVNDEISILLAVDPAGTYACYVNGVLETSGTCSANNGTVELPHQINTNINGVATYEQNVFAVWWGDGYNDTYSDFFDGSDDPTADMTSGANIGAATCYFAQAGNAAAWNALAGTTGTITDA